MHSSERRSRASRSPFPKRRAGDVSVAAAVTEAGAAVLECVSPASTHQGADQKALISVIIAAVKSMDGKIFRVQGAVDRLTSLVTTNTVKVEGLAFRVQATASTQATTASTMVAVQERVSEVLFMAASRTPDG